MSYLKLLPKSLLEDIVEGNCIPIIGAGFSLNVEGKKPLNWNELGEKISIELDIFNYVYDGPIDAISYYEEEFSRAKLIEKITELLNIHNIAPSGTHKAFAELKFKQIITTNFDCLLEKSYETNCNVVTNESMLSTNFKGTTSIYKLHGDLSDPNRMVLTEKDYDLFLNKNPILSTFIANLFITKTPLLIGYSFNDPDTRLIWRIIEERLGNMRRKAYVILPYANQSNIDRYTRRGVKAISLNCEKGKEKEAYTELFKELNAYWMQKLNDKPSINIDVDTSLKYKKYKKICFLSCVVEKFEHYKELLMPLFSENNITIASMYDLVPGDIIFSKVLSIMEQVDFAFVDLRDNNKMVLSELEYLLSKNIKCFVIGNFEKNSNKDMKNFRQFLGYDDMNDALKIYVSSLNNNEDSLNNRVDKLLKEKNYEYAVLEAYKELEKKYIRYDNNKKYYDSQYYSNNFRQIRDVRNTIVHGNINLNKKEAEQILSQIFELLSKASM